MVEGWCFDAQASSQGFQVYEIMIYTGRVHHPTISVTVRSQVGFEDAFINKTISSVGGLSLCQPNLGLDLQGCLVNPALGVPTFLAPEYELRKQQPSRAAELTDQAWVIRFALVLSPVLWPDEVPPLLAAQVSRCARLNNGALLQACLTYRLVPELSASV